MIVRTKAPTNTPAKKEDGLQEIFAAARRMRPPLHRRLVRAVAWATIVYVGGYLVFAVLMLPRLPNSPEGLKYHLIAYTVVLLFFLAAFRVEAWVKAQVKNYWFWRVSTALVFTGAAVAILYFMFQSGDAWMPHFNHWP